MDIYKKKDDPAFPQIGTTQLQGTRGSDIDQKPVRRMLFGTYFFGNLTELLSSWLATFITLTIIVNFPGIEDVFRSYANSTIPANALLNIILLGFPAFSQLAVRGLLSPEILEVYQSISYLIQSYGPLFNLRRTFGLGSFRQGSPPNLNLPPGATPDPFSGTNLLNLINKLPNNPIVSAIEREFPDLIIKGPDGTINFSSIVTGIFRQGSYLIITTTTSDTLTIQYP